MALLQKGANRIPSLPVRFGAVCSEGLKLVERDYKEGCKSNSRLAAEIFHASRIPLLPVADTDRSVYTYKERSLHCLMMIGHFLRDPLSTTLPAFQPSDSSMVSLLLWKNSRRKGTRMTAGID